MENEVVRERSNRGREEPGSDGTKISKTKSWHAVRALERDPIRFSNFHLITALIKANRSERKRQFHYSELTVVAEWSKDIRSGRNPTLAFTIPAVLIAKITAPFDPEKFRFPMDPRDSMRSSNSSVVNDNNPPFLRRSRPRSFFFHFDCRRKRRWRFGYGLSNKSDIPSAHRVCAPRVRTNDYQDRIRICVVFFRGGERDSRHRWKSNRTCADR